MILKKIAVASALSLTVLGASAAQVSLVNADFENGTLGGWNSLGSVVATPSTSVTTYDNTVYTISAAGTTMAQLQSSNVAINAIEAALGLAPGTLNAYNINNGKSLTNGSALYQSFSADVGDSIDMSWNYVATDYTPFNDPAFALLIGPTNSIQVLASIQGPGTAVGTSGNSGWQNFSSLINASGNYTLAFVTTNDGDTLNNSYLHVDASLGSCTPNCPPPDPVPVPVPGTLLLSGLGLGVMGWTRRRKAA